MDYSSDNYTTVAEVQTYLDRELTTGEQATLGFVIPAASRWIDRSLGTTFSKVVAPTAKHFKGGWRNISIQPCQNITLVQAINPYDNSVWYTYTTPIEYIAEPYDLPVKRYLQMRRNEFTGHDLRWPGDDIGILVTAQFTEYNFTNNDFTGATGGDYPNDIKLLANHIAAIWLQNNQNAEPIQREEVEGHTVIKRVTDMLESDPMVTRVLDSRKEIWLED